MTEAGKQAAGTSRRDRLSQPESVGSRSCTRLSCPLRGGVPRSACRRPPFVMVFSTENREEGKGDGGSTFSGRPEKADEARILPSWE